LIFLFASQVSYGYLSITKKQEDQILKTMNAQLNLNPFYVFGAVPKNVSDATDCSGEGMVFKMAGVKGLTRSVAGCMSEGRDGWNFPETTFESAKRLALVFTTPKRRCGKYCVKRVKGKRVKRKFPCERTHVQYALADCQYGKLLRVVHASSKYGLIAVIIKKDPKDYWYPKIDTIRQVIWDR
jgi:hypothetical protein